MAVCLCAAANFFILYWRTFMTFTIKKFALTFLGSLLMATAPQFAMAQAKNTKQIGRAHV
jgi:hypothetical protein